MSRNEIETRDGFVNIHTMGPSIFVSTSYNTSLAESPEAGEVCLSVDEATIVAKAILRAVAEVERQWIGLHLIPEPPLDPDEPNRCRVEVVDRLWKMHPGQEKVRKKLLDTLPQSYPSLEEKHLEEKQRDEELMVEEFRKELRKRPTRIDGKLAGQDERLEEFKEEVRARRRFREAMEAKPADEIFPEDRPAKKEKREEERRDDERWPDPWPADPIAEPSPSLPN